MVLAGLGGKESKSIMQISNHNYVVPTHNFMVGKPRISIPSANSTNKIQMS